MSIVCSSRTWPTVPNLLWMLAQTQNHIQTDSMSILSLLAWNLTVSKHCSTPPPQECENMSVGNSISFPRIRRDSPQPYPSIHGLTKWTLHQVDIRIGHLSGGPLHWRSFMPSVVSRKLDSQWALSGFFSSLTSSGSSFCFTFAAAMDV